MICSFLQEKIIHSPDRSTEHFSTFCSVTYEHNYGIAPHFYIFKTVCANLFAASKHFFFIWSSTFPNMATPLQGSTGSSCNSFYPPTPHPTFCNLVMPLAAINLTLTVSPRMSNLNEYKNNFENGFHTNTVLKHIWKTEYCLSH